MASNPTRAGATGFYGPADEWRSAILHGTVATTLGVVMATAKKKSSKKRASGQVGWAETMKKALENKKPPGGFPDQGKPRDSVVKKVRKNAY
jgi:hypothetical protein